MSGIVASSNTYQDPRHFEHNGNSCFTWPVPNVFRNIWLKRKKKRVIVTTHDRYYFFDLGGQWYVCAPPPPPHTLLTPHFYFPLELYVYLTLTNNYLAFFIYQSIILWIILKNWHRWLLVNNHISKYNSFILVLYRRYINYVTVCTPPPLPTPLINP